MAAAAAGGLRSTHDSLRSNMWRNTAVAALIQGHAGPRANSWGRGGSRTRVAFTASDARAGTSGFCESKSAAGDSYCAVAWQPCV